MTIEKIIEEKLKLFERQFLLEALFKSDDENVKQALNDVLSVVKILYGEELNRFLTTKRSQLEDEQRKSLEKLQFQLDCLILERIRPINSYDRSSRARSIVDEHHLKLIKQKEKIERFKGTTKRLLTKLLSMLS